MLFIHLQLEAHRLEATRSHSLRALSIESQPSGWIGHLQVRPGEEIPEHVRVGCSEDPDSISGCWIELVCTTEC